MESQARKRVFRQNHTAGPAHGSTKAKVNLDANSERNAGFYKQDGFVAAYPKYHVYPPEGGEVQLEQLRARLPKYCPPPSHFAPKISYDDMEMTCCADTNITILPGMKNKENVSVVPVHPKPSSDIRRPLQPVVRAPTTSLSSVTLSPVKELDRMCQERQELGGPAGQLVSREAKGRESSSEAISELLDDMMLQQSVEREMERQNNKPASSVQMVKEPNVNHIGLPVKEDLGHMVNQENAVYRPHTSTNPQKTTSSARNKSCALRLNFSDAESSLGTSQLSSLMEDSVGGRASVLGHSQVRVLEQSGTGGQSFEVFHDSWRNQSHNTSHGRSQQSITAKQPAATCRYFGKPLERMPPQDANRHEADVSSFAESCDQSSFQAVVSKSNMSSFSAYEDSVERSSFIPFHDSWVNTSKDVQNKRPGSADESASMPTTGLLTERVPRSGLPNQQKQQLGTREGGGVYHATLGVPLEGDGMVAGNASVIDQSFTQIGICHPKHAPNISTPVSKKIDFTFDMSRIQNETEVLPSSVHPSDHPQHPSIFQRKRSVASTAINLSTIKEESSSLKSSHSSGCTTATSSSSSSCSQSSHESSGHHMSACDLDVNPFSPEIVNMMLNALSVSVMDSMCCVSSALPQLVSGRTVVLGDQEFTGIKKVTSGGFGTIYTCRRGKETKVLKVQKPAMKWEIAIISELHTRLYVSNLMFGSQCFVNSEQSFVFDNASVMVLPHYKYGSLLDLANAHGTKLQESFLFYYTAELLEMVASLHHCGILHTDIKPDNFMIADISSFKNFASAQCHGLVLIDFGRAVDLTAFPGDTMFRGSCETEGFQCTQMLEGKPWKYEADYFGIAATVHVLLTGQYMSVVRDAQTNIYRLQNPLPRSHRRSLWNDFFSCLLNTTQPLPLPELAAEMRANTGGLKDYVFQAFFKRILTTIENHLSQHS